MADFASPICPTNVSRSWVGLREIASMALRNKNHRKTATKPEEIKAMTGFTEMRLPSSLAKRNTDPITISKMDSAKKRKLFGFRMA